MTTETLRKRAEARLKGAPRLKKCALPGRRLAQELETHRVELELQNEELERARAEADAIRERYVELYDHAPVPYLTLDESGRILEANLAAEALLGVDRSLLHKKPLSAFMRPTDADAFHVFRHGVLRCGAKRSSDLMVRCSGGLFRVLRILVSVPDHEAKGECRCALLDVSDLREAEEARRAAESNAQAVLDAAPDSIVTIDLSGRIVSFNAAAQRAFGYEHDEVLARPAEMLVPPSYREEHRAYLRHCMATGEAKLVGKHGRVVLGLRKDGSTFPLELNVAEWRGRGERMFTAVLRDVSEREDALTRLRETQERFHLITEHVDDVFYIAESNGRILYVSPAYERIWGRPAAEILERPGGWPADVAPQDQRDVESAVRSLRRGEPVDIEYRIIRRNGTTAWIHDRAFPIDDACGGVARVVGVARDRTNERELELELRQVQKMEAIGTLSSAIAHDFNNVLQVVVGATALAADENTPPEQARQFLSRAKDMAMRGAELVHRITGFARKEHVQPREVPIDDAVRNAATLVRPLLGQHIELTLDLRASGALVRANQVQIEQILLNLASNSRDAMPTGGTFTVTTERLAKSAVSEERVRLLVSDTGCGMDDVTKSRAFDPFFTTKAAGQGTGLGLATVLAVAEQLGGDVHLDSVSGRGTTVVVELSTCEPREASSHQVDASTRFHGTALLVEDEPLVRKSVRRQLELLGFDVLEAETPRRALALVHEGAEPPRVVVSDVLMPEMTGPQLVGALRVALPRLPALYVSGDPGRVLDTSSLDARTRLLPKPFDHRDLVAHLGELFEAESSPAPSIDSREDGAPFVAEASPVLENEEACRHAEERDDAAEANRNLTIVVRRRQGNGVAPPRAFRTRK